MTHRPLGIPSGAPATTRPERGAASTPETGTVTPGTTTLGTTTRRRSDRHRTDRFDHSCGSHLA